ncbi:hypothetical protein WA1_06085 [Scytonema hofmannii PCC 7110]|uniref:Filamentous haemagglutinin FhaB/tRNA nuclease CdiA-like TPS domain-containing protein n=1 Tax=Scytonema hofmannii PCC 7110 TaxID=128403 RepID=A0A139WSI1_9CYAN|nr:filamentous hemagglutinin N-terminal domain-containing protein [Scytonema hofmannii]KYC35392.1 hypothetical protein WA1_06085 [Scytonema hofmannii PCC 7110]
MSGVFVRLGWLTGLKIAIGGTLIFWSNSTLAQVTPDTTLGAEGSVVTPNVEIKGVVSDAQGQELEVLRIDGGAIRGGNLFHSFQEFNVGEGRGVYFTNPQGIENILSRVTGANRSEILGRLGVLGNANLFLLNPSGIVFGQNASLDVEGSFVASTASSLKFADSTEFNATNPQSTPLLTINVPIGLQFGSNAASVSISGSRLQVNPGKSLALVGGNVSINGGKLIAPSGRVELGGVAGENTVKLFPNGDFFGLNFPQGVPQANVSLTNQAEVNVRSSNGGSIAVNAANVNMSGRSQLLAGISGIGSPNTQAGDIKINATGTVAIADDSRIFNEVARNAVGNSGSINIITGSLKLTNGAELSASTYGKGDAGTVNITATDAIKLDGKDNNGFDSDVSSTNSKQISLILGRLLDLDFFKTFFPRLNGEGGSECEVCGTRVNSGVFSIVESGAEGKAGDVTISTGSLELTNGADISTSTYGKGDAGSVNITATNAIKFNDSNAFSQVNSGAEGKAGGVTIRTGSLELTNGAQLSASTSGRDAGSVNITATDFIKFDGEDKDGFNSGAFSQVNSGAEGKAGGVTIRTGSLELTNGAQLSASTSGKGDAGSVNITATDFTKFDGEDKDGFNSGAFSQVNSGAEGTAGGVTIRTGSLELTNGAQLSASTSGKGDAGSVNITATDFTKFDGEDKDGFNSGAFSQVNSGAEGTAGGVTIRTGSLELTNGAQLSASTSGKGDAGSVNIGVGSLELTNGAVISASTNGKGDAGSVNITATDFIKFNDSVAFSQVNSGAVGKAGDVTISTGSLDLNDGAVISASTFGKGDAGSVNITATDFIKFDGEDKNGFNSGAFSQVSSEAVGTAGGVTIRTGSLELTNGAVISASTNGKGNAGSVNITVTDVIKFDGEDKDGNSSGAFSQVSSGAVGTAGGVTISTSSLELTNGAAISASTNGKGDAGSINLNVTGLFSATDSEIVTSATQSSGGAIAITAGNIRLYGDSDITTNVETETGGGGDITLTANSIIAFDDSDILAFARDGKGGNINLNTRAFFGQNYQKASSALVSDNFDGNNRVDINASGAISSGVVTVPDTSFIQDSLSELPENAIDTGSLIANSCIARGSRQQEGTFVITGSGGLPTSPGNVLMSQYTFGTARTVSNTLPSANSPRRRWQKGDPIVEPQGVYQLSSGQLVLSRECF